MKKLPFLRQFYKDWKKKKERVKKRGLEREIDCKRKKDK